MPLLLLIALLAAGQVAPTLAAIDGRSPEQSGDILLAGREHGIVEKIERVPLNGAIPPGMFRYDLIERPKATVDGCVRTRWVTDFTSGPGEPQRAAELSSVYAATDVAVPSATGCTGKEFVPAQPGITPRDAVRALAYFYGVRANPTAAILSCSDKTPIHLCRDGKAIRRGLAQGKILWVEREGDTIAINLTMSEGEAEPISTIRFSASRPAGLRIVRAYPPPF